MKKTTVQMVEQFHTTFGHPVGETIAIPTSHRAELRLRLIEEELRELREAVAANDVVGVADALTDLQYVLDGFFIESGMHTIKEELFEEVHRSNMTKACATEEEADQTCKFVLETLDFECAYQKKEEGAFIVYRISDNKIMKSVNYSPAKLSPIVLK